MMTLAKALIGARTTASFPTSSPEIYAAKVGNDFSYIPAILSARLAVAQMSQGMIHPPLMTHQAQHYAASARRGRLIVVDAIDESAEGFYRHHGFTPTGQAGRLVVEASDVARTLGYQTPL